ncbi:hypothetical protein CLAIMM_13365 [Cladophialophora immunda]|nr:hypothetical protein CLAIMM_13365 [Cladophialophora immunda]
MAYQKQSISPVSSSDLPFLSDLVHTCKLALPINRLLFKDWPNDAAQKPLYAAAVESAFKGESVDCLKSVDQQPGDILAYLALTRKRPHTGSTETQPPSGKGIGSEKQQDIPEFFNSEVLSLSQTRCLRLPRERKDSIISSSRISASSLQPVDME